MAELTDPGGTTAGETYVQNTNWKLPDLAIVPGYETARRLTGEDEDFITLSDPPPDPRDTSAIQDTLPAHVAGDEVPVSSGFTVRPSSIRDLETQILTELKTQVEDFQTFKKTIADTEGWIFLVGAPHDMDPYQETHGSYRDGYTTETKVFHDPHPEQTQQIVNSQNALVRNLAEGYRLMGQVVALLNNAAQNYVKADKALFDHGPTQETVPLPKAPDSSGE